MEKEELDVLVSKLMDAEKSLKKYEFILNKKIDDDIRRFIIDCMIMYSGKILDEQNTEISDSEIDKEITARFTSVMPNGYKVIFKEACQWYREQIKLK